MEVSPRSLIRRCGNQSLESGRFTKILGCERNFGTKARSLALPRGSSVRPKRSRPNPRWPEDVGEPWDVSVPLEDLPNAVAAACRLALAKGHIAWAGAWSPTLPGRTAYVIQMGPIDETLSDALAEASFEAPKRQPEVLWTWFSAPHRGPRWLAMTDAERMLAWLLRSDRMLGTIAACACARYALRWVHLARLQALRAIQTTENWTHGTTSFEMVENVWRASGMSASNSSSSREHYALAAAIETPGLVIDPDGGLRSAAEVVRNVIAAAVSMSDDTGGYSHLMGVAMRMELSDVIRYRVDPFAGATR